MAKDEFDYYDGALLDTRAEDAIEQEGHCKTGLTRDLRLQTPAGIRRLRDIRVGDLVDTADRGPLPVLWIVQNRLSREELAAEPALCPVRIRRGALGPCLPRRDLILAPGHRLAIAGGAGSKTSGALVSAADLVGAPGIEVLPPNRGWNFYQLLLPQHALLITEGCPSESLPAAEARGLGDALPIRIDGLPLMATNRPDSLRVTPEMRLPRPRPISEAES